jgi:hypothetical protein
MNRYTDLEALERLCSLVEEAGVDIAPHFDQYTDMAFGIANTLGEAGRTCFHRLCTLCPKYETLKADKLYTDAIAKGRGANGLGTVFYLAEQAGIRLGDLKGFSRNPKDPPLYFRAGARSYYTSSPSYGDNLENSLQKEPFSGGKNPRNPNGWENFAPKEKPDALPYEKEFEDLPGAFSTYAWPRFLQRITDCGEDPAQRDILFSGAIAALGATVCKNTSFYYGHKNIYPCLQVFILAPAASGKGALNWIRYLVMPFHREKTQRFDVAMKLYNQELSKWSNEGRQRDETMRPERPKLELFFIAGNNSGTGIQENIIDNNGEGFILEPEADVLASAIKADYGQWSHLLRKAHDHEFLSYNRRKDHEYRECDLIRLTVLISGTPNQLVQLIPGAENGLFSRQLFYYMPPLDDFKNMLIEGATEDYSVLFQKWGYRWKKVVDAVNSSITSIRFLPTPGQAEALYESMSQLFHHAGTAHGGSMRSSVVRLAINLLRIMNVVALLRALDGLLMEEDEEVLNEKVHNIVRTLLECPGITPAVGTHTENIKDGVLSRLELNISDEDFAAVLALAEPLYRHAEHALMSLPAEDTVERTVSAKEQFLSKLPMNFTRQDYIKAGEDAGLNNKQCDHMIEKLLNKRILVRRGHGLYSFRGGQRPSDDELLSNFEKTQE